MLHVIPAVALSCKHHVSRFICKNQRIVFLHIEQHDRGRFEGGSVIIDVVKKNTDGRVGRGGAKIGAVQFVLFISLARRKIMELNQEKNEVCA